MEPRIRYCVELSQIENHPSYNRIRAETRLFLLKEFSDQVEPREKRRLGNRYRVKPAVLAYCCEKGIGPTSFFRWRREYRRYGITGLLPRFGTGGGAAARTAKPGHVRLAMDIDPLRPLLCLRQLLAFVLSSSAIPPERARAAAAYLEREIPLLKRYTALSLPRTLTPEERQTLELYRAGVQKNHRAKALALLMIDQGCTMEEVSRAAARATNTIYRWLRLFKTHGLAFIETHMDEAGHAQIWQRRRVKVIEILHEPPSLHGINRSSWSLVAIRQAYMRKHGEDIPTAALTRVLRLSGYSWRHARKVLTSSDASYKEKLGSLVDALHGLQPDEAFFFIDEAGPWRVKKYGGKALAKKGETPTIPEVQTSRGAVYLVAALEARRNQVSWRFTEGKSAAAVVELLKIIRREYDQCSRICLTWDALSSHSAAEVTRWIDEANASHQVDGMPRVEVYPLPSNAQFLNLVESVFSSLRRAVIHNSNYASKEEMQAAIARYFEERNAYFREHPKRAGNKIWDRETLKIDELPGGLYRRM